MITKEQQQQVQFELDRNTVQRALRNAVLNGYVDVCSDSPMQVAVDLVTYDSDLEGFEPDEIVQHVQYWQENDRLVRLATKVIY